MYLDVSHIAVVVPNLREAEQHYQELFGLEVAWRESSGTVAASASWDELEAAGMRPDVSFLWRDRFRLALEAGSQLPSGRINHIGLQVTPDELGRMRGVVDRLELSVLHQHPDEAITFADKYGVEWELDTLSYSDPVALGRVIERRRAR